MKQDPLEHGHVVSAHSWISQTPSNRVARQHDHLKMKIQSAARQTERLHSLSGRGGMQHAEPLPSQRAMFDASRREPLIASVFEEKPTAGGIRLRKAHIELQCGERQIGQDLFVNRALKCQTGQLAPFGDDR